MITRQTQFCVGCGILCLSIIITACNTVPVTGRSAINIVSDEEVIKMSNAAFAEMKFRYGQSRNHQHIALVNKVGERMAKAISWDMLNADWEFVVFENPNRINAFAMAGGKVGVFSGLFRIVESEEDLAVVIGHELAHVAAKHVNERLSQDILIKGGSIAAAVATGGQEVLIRNAVMDAYGLGSQLGTYAFTRKKEIEADYIGLIYMARAGYDPELAIDFWERMHKETQGKPVPPQWLSTHPSHQDRILLLHRHMPEAVEVFEGSSGKPKIRIIQ